jgi:hypothetical protein
MLGRQPWHGAMNILKSASNFLVVNDPAGPCDLIYVLAGRPERKPYGLDLFHRGLAPRLILSVGRFEVRQTASLLEMPRLLALRDNLPPEQRHFWIDFQCDAPARISPANLKKPNTFWELSGLVEYLHNTSPARIAIISTSIHLRRVRYCCSRIPFLARKTVSFLAVPEEASSFKLNRWWKHRGHWHYVINEHLKLAAYRAIY